MTNPPAAGPAKHSDEQKRSFAAQKHMGEQMRAFGATPGIHTLAEQKRARCKCGGHKFKNSRPEKLLDGSLIRRCTRCNLPIA